MDPGQDANGSVVACFTAAGKVSGQRCDRYRQRFKDQNATHTTGLGKPASQLLLPDCSKPANLGVALWYDFAGRKMDGPNFGN
jgi:hypothetical protein